LLRGKRTPLAGLSKLFRTGKRRKRGGGIVLNPMLSG